MTPVVIARRFELISHAAQGGMGSVYRGRDRQTGHAVAVKVLTQARPIDVVRFKREAEVLATISHPNIVDYVAHGDEEGVRYLVQEWVDGVTLSSLLRTKGLTAREVIAITDGVAKALGATHARGIIHRDVKPSNIILAGGSPDQVKLVDFGVARLAHDAGVITRTGVMVGTPSYMAPEQALGNVNIEPAADVWSLGCVLYEGLSGRIAFAGQTPTAIRAKVLLGEVRPLGEQCREAPRELLVLVDDMLSKDPNKRPRSGADVVARIAALPQLPDGPTRRVGTAEPPTVAMPVGPAADVANAYVFFAVTSDPDDDMGQPTLRDDQLVARIAARHNLAVHTFDDGSRLLESSDTGAKGAAAAARAAMELRSEVFDGAISVFGRAFTDTFETAIDRGSLILERAMVKTLFTDLDDDPRPCVHVDQVIADLVGSELPVDASQHGPIIRVKTRG